MRLQFEFDKRQQNDAEHGTFELAGDNGFEMKENPAANEDATDGGALPENDSDDQDGSESGENGSGDDGQDAGEEQPDASTASLYG
jgi:hypothetical protein